MPSKDDEPRRSAVENNFFAPTLKTWKVKHIQNSPCRPAKLSVTQAAIAQEICKVRLAKD